MRSCGFKEQGRKMLDFEIKTATISYSGHPNSATRTFTYFSAMPIHTAQSGNQDSYREMYEWCLTTFGDNRDYDGTTIWTVDFKGCFYFLHEKHRTLFVLRFKGI